MTEPFYNNAEHLSAEMSWLNPLLRGELGRCGADSVRPFVSQYEAERLIAEVERDGTVSPYTAEAAARRVAIDEQVSVALQQNVRLPLAQLRKSFRLCPLEYGACVIALAPELDVRYERIFGYLQDDLSRRKPTVDLVLRLLCRSARQSLTARTLFTSESPLFSHDILVDSGGGPTLQRTVVLDDLMLAYLIETPGLPKHLLPFVRKPEPAINPRDLRWPEHLTGALSRLISQQLARRDLPNEGVIIHLEGPEGTGRAALASAICAEASIPLLPVNVRELAAHTDDVIGSLRLLLRQGCFTESALFLENFDTIVQEEGKAAGTRVAVEQALADLSWITFVGTECGWSPRNEALVPRMHSFALPYPDTHTREALWKLFTAESATGFNGTESGLLAARFRMTPGQMRGALAGAHAKAKSVGRSVTLPDVVESCHTVSQRKLGHLARRLKPRRSWRDITVPANTLAQLQEICNQVRRRSCVYERWGFERRMSLGKGLCALFYGPSGAGKTMAVEIIAGELALDAYKIDLATVVSKYIGETEKNLSKIFDEAENSNALLFFDEADALFGKRSEVKDARDRYANIEINFLLQRIEEYDGLVILASNMRKHIDEGFFRRMQFAVEFPLPEASDRYRIWKQHLPPEAPVSADVDFDFLASRFAIAGGNIKNIVLNAAFLAAETSLEISMAHFLRATRSEFQKMGHVCTDPDFAPYQNLLRSI